MARQEAAQADEAARPAVAVIPARGGSKRIPQKNIRSFLGTPLLERTIEILTSSRLFARVVVSTEDDQVATVARSAGAEVPFVRPANLADDHTVTHRVMAHAVRALEELSGAELDLVCCVYPTAVLLDVGDLRAAHRTMLTSGVDFVASATTFPSPVQRALRIRADGLCEMVWPEHEHTRSQDLEEWLHDAGQFYWGTRAAWLGDRGPFSGSVRSRLQVLPRWRVVDIDTPDDWEHAEVVYRAVHGR